MAVELDADWNELRGFEVQSVGIASVSYDDDSRKLIDMRNKGAMLGDASVREGYVQGSMARGFEAAGSNEGGAMGAFVGMGMGAGAGGAMFGTMSETNRRQMEAERSTATGWSCSCGSTGNSGNFCPSCGKKRPESGTWTCSCGTVSGGNFCPSCGNKRPSAGWFCPDCGAENSGSFCSGCGKKRP
jgi:membrane protease subunit (stomatin/prohibitin family)